MHSKYQVNAAGGKKMRKKYLRELKKNLKESNLFWEDDYQDDKKVEQISLFE